MPYFTHVHSKNFLDISLYFKSMSKIAFLSFAIAAASTAAAAVYYVSPATFQQVQATPPILVDAPPEQIMPKVHAIRLENYLAHVSDGKEALPDFIKMRESKISAFESQFNLFIGTDNPLRFSVIVRPVEGGKSEVHVKSVLPASRFMATAALHPFEAELLASMADYAATDYVSSLIKGHRAMTHKEVSAELKKRVDAQGYEPESLGKRIAASAEQNYMADYAAWERRNGHKSYARHNAEQTATEAVEAAQDAAQAGAEAAAEAAYEAGSAAEAVAAKAASAADQARFAAEQAQAATRPTPGWGQPGYGN